MRVACVMMQKNEEQCLDPWVKYHGYMFGFENLYIVDHNSTSDEVLRLLDQYERTGVNVTRLPAGADYKDKGQFVAREIQRIDAREKFDFVLPLDCDEFVFLKEGENRETCSRDAICNHLKQFEGFEGVLRVRENYLHILGHPGYYWSQSYQKSFFAGGQCLTLDHGSHIGTARSSSEIRPTSLVYAHFHFKPYHIDQELSREKLRPWVNVDDMEALKAFDGPGRHLIDHVLQTESEYYSKFSLDDRAIYFKDMADKFVLLGVSPNFCATDSSARNTSMKKAFVDLGANIGEMSERFAISHPEFDIFCIEPNARLLPSIIERSARAARPFWVMWAAAWVKDGSVELFESSAHQAATVVPGKVEHSGWPQIDYTRPTTVPSLDFSAWLRRMLGGYDEIVIKMDIEGAEYPVLEKMVEDRTLGLVTRMMCEWHVDRYPEIGTERHEVLKAKVADLTKLERWD